MSERSPTGTSPPPPNSTSLCVGSHCVARVHQWPIHRPAGAATRTLMKVLVDMEAGARRKGHPGRRGGGHTRSPRGCGARDRGWLKKMMSLESGGGK